MSQSLGCESKGDGVLANPDISQAQIQGFELTHFNIYPINELLKCMKGMVL